MQSDQTETPATVLSVRIDAARAAMLWTTSTSAAGIDLEGRFGIPRHGDYVHDDAPEWEGGRVMWCETALESIVLADYEEACGYRSQLLWDLDAADWNGPGHAVLSSRPTNGEAANPES